jgi:hypothetical protein
MWLTLAAAGSIGAIALITLVRAEKSVPNGVLTVITLLAVAIAGAATVRGFDAGPEATGPSQATNAALPALACMDELAGDTVLGACEKALFGSAENAAAAISYAASQITRLTAFGDVATANRSMTLELHALRRAVERDRYGLVAQVLLARDHCSPADCAAFRALTDNRQISANMDQRFYDGVIARYAPTWGAPPPNAAAPLAMLSSSMPSGKPTTADFPSAASTPAISIMSPEPSAAAGPSAARAPPSSGPPANAPLPSPRPATSASAAGTTKKPAAPKQTSAAPVQLAPAPTAAAPEASND